MDTVTQSVGISRLLKPPLDSNAPVSIFWDFENCHVPIDVDPDAIAGNIKAALFDYGLTGPLTIRAYGNLGTLGRRVQVALINSGVDVRDVPPDGKKETTDKRILTDLMLHACDHPAPQHILLVSGDEDFTYGLHRLALRCYHVHVALNLESGLVAQPALQRLTASGRAWQWQALLRGDVAAMPYTETLGVPAFAGVPPLRQAPVREKVPPPERSEPAASPVPKDDSSEASARLPISGRASRSEPHPIPALVKSQVSAVLEDSPPQGITISELQKFLARKGFTLDYRGLGYKQLLALMQAMPDVVAVTIPGERSSNKQYYLRPAAIPEFAKSAPSTKGRGGTLSADISLEVAQDVSPEPAGPSEEVMKEDGRKEKGQGPREEVKGAGRAEKKGQGATIPDDSAKRLRPLVAETRQRPSVSPIVIQKPFFRKILNSISALLRRPIG